MPAVCPHRKDDIQCRKIGDEWLLYDPATSTLHVVNATAEFVWGLCDGTHTPDDLGRRVAEEFETSPDADVAGDLADILKSFAEKGLLRADGSL